MTNTMVVAGRIGEDVSAHCVQAPRFPWRPKGWEAATTAGSRKPADSRKQRTRR